MKISKKIIIMGSVLLTICIVVSIILINANKKDDLISNIIEKEETEILDITSEQGNKNEMDNEISNIINNDDIQTIDKDESMDIVEQKTYDEKIDDNSVKPKQETKVETPNKTITTNTSSNKTNNQSNNTNQSIKTSKQEESITETKIPEKTAEPETETKPTTPQEESYPVVEKQEETKQEESKKEETIPTETKPSRTYKINTTYINKLKQTVITEVTNNLDKLNKYGITSVEQYTIIDDDNSMCAYNGGHRSGWTYENPSAYATFKSSILKGTSIKIYAVDEYQNGVYIQTLCYYGH
ncbi:MAG: hypothetical protein E7310_05075 [Clostridiales bacterium]|nr:hypothetical protein [Clostridiales bacterium]